ncbi:MAG: SDR family NAD-dependent epimerase/dehydratase [Nitrospirae bacterium]|nr:MAG: SDR family NAD-dependent epimerase/dehydratase [Nitrospirota bacterium]
MKIVVTGALGHIGSRLIRELPSMFHGAKIFMVDNLATQRYPSLFNLPAHGNYRFIEADVLEHDIEAVMDGATVVVHLAAITDAANSFNNREKVEYVNYNATARVAEACGKTGCAMIHLSSTSVYGTQAAVVDENCTEDELKPQSPYAETKLKEERLLKELGTSKGGRFVSCRFGTITGISAGMRFHTAVNKFCWQAVFGQPLTVWTTALHQKRPYLDLGDAVQAIKFIIENELYDGNVYNILTENLTVNDIINYIKKSVPAIEIKYVDTQIMNQLSYDVSNKRFADKGFSPKIALSRSIGETISLLRSANTR